MYVTPDATSESCRSLGAINKNPRGESMARPTIRKRLASGLDPMYSATFPLDIHSEMMRKYRGFSDKETPNRGKMFG